MKTSLVRITAIALLAVGSLATSACARHAAASPTVEGKRDVGQSGVTDTAFAAMQERGKSVMGVDQNASTHQFKDLPDGGTITLTSDAGARTDVDAIRAHLREISKSFAAGDFTDPSMVHMMEVPGTDVMGAHARDITYTYSEVARGGQVRIRTGNGDAIRAVHAFLEFQRTSHHTHDTP